MNDVATFFRDREKDAGETYQLEIKAPKGTYRLSVFAQRSFESSALNRHAVEAQKDYDLLVKDLRGIVSSAGGGGVIVSAFDENGSRTLTVTGVPAKSYQPPEECIVLAPGRPPVPLRSAGTGYKYPAGAHLIVPVDEDAQERLQHFISYLRWLSPDLESLVLNAIRRPSLDRRLERVEKELFGRTTDQAIAASSAKGWARLRNMLARSVPPPVTHVTAAVLLVLFLAMNGFLLYRLESRLDELTPADSGVRTSSAKSSGDARSQGATPTLNGNPADEVRALLAHVRDKRDSDPILAKIDRTHFASLGHASSDRQIAQALKKATDQPAVLWGLIKLQLLELGAKLEGAEEISATKDVLKRIPREKREADRDGERLLTALECRLAQSDCAELSDAEMEKGLQGLVAFVDGRP